jgi:FkbM family methyltransferase
MELLQKVKIYGFSKSLHYIYLELRNLLFKRLLQGSYSQNGEDLLIDRLLNYKKSGFYVDIGAHDTTRFSNTKKFYKKGLRGLNIDPNLNLIKKFEEQRRKDINLAVGIGSKVGTLTFYEFLPSTLSTLSKDEADKYINEGFRLVGKSKVQVKTLESILDKYCKSVSIDFLSVDTEGTDLKCRNK